MSKHYDVAVLGAGLGALAAAVLLARRSWRVLVVGQGHRPAHYTYRDLPLARRPFTMLAAETPAWTRILVEIAQSQTWARRARAREPALQVLAPKLRFDLPRDPAALGREIDREFPALRRVVDDLVADLARTSAAADAAFAADLVWPPGGFWERREATRALAQVPRAAGVGDVLSELGASHTLRRAAELAATFASDLAGALPPFAVARLLGSYLRGVVELPRGEAELTELLVERIKAHGGDVLPSERATNLVTKGGRVVGVELGDEGATVGVQFVVGDMAAADLVALAAEFEPSARAAAAMPTLVARRRRFVVSAVVARRGLPSLLGHEALLLPAKDEIAVRLQREDLDGDAALLVAEALIPEGARPRAWRERVLRAVEAHLSFVDEHLRVVDSPHDGRPLWDYQSGARVDVERALLRAGGGVVDEEPMTAQLEVTPGALGGLAGDALRTPLGNAFVVGKTCMPALGQEGELLSAWGVARIITRTDRRKEKMRRELWSKIEIG